MNELVEIEFKVLVSQETFYKVLEDYKAYVRKDYVQTNHYLTNALLKEKKYMLRIRDKDDTHEMTLKRPYQNHRLETNIMISLKDKEDILNGKYIDNEIINILKDEEFDISTIQNEVSLTTHRYDIELNEGTLSLDINTYNNITDYEIEFEVQDEKKGFETFLNIIQPYDIEYIPNIKSKVKRALDSMN